MKVLLIWLLAVSGVFAEEQPPGGIAQSEATEDYGPQWDEPAPQKVVAKSLTEWIKAIEYVEAVVYDNRVEPEVWLVQSGKIHRGVVDSLTKRLTPQQIARLESQLTGTHAPQPGGFCGYDPHHGFIFYGKDARILGHIEICFLCTSGFHNPPNGLSSNWGFEGIEKLVVELGLPTFNKRERWAAFFAELKEAD